MGFIKIIASIIASLPSLIAIIKQVIDLINSLPKSDRLGAAMHMAHAMKEAKQGNPGPIKDFHDYVCESQSANEKT